MQELDSGFEDANEPVTAKHDRRSRSHPPVTEPMPVAARRHHGAWRGIMARDQQMRLHGYRSIGVVDVEPVDAFSPKRHFGIPRPLEIIVLF